MSSKILKIIPVGHQFRVLGGCCQLVNLTPEFDEYYLKNRSFLFNPQITQITRIVKVVKREGITH